MVKDQRAEYFERWSLSDEVQVREHCRHLFLKLHNYDDYYYMQLHQHCEVLQQRLYPAQVAVFAALLEGSSLYEVHRDRSNLIHVQRIVRHHRISLPYRPAVGG